MERMSLLCTLLALVVGIQGLDVTIGGDSPSLSGVINQKFDSSIKPVMSQQLLTYFQHMITQAFNDLENRMEDKLSQLQSELNDKITSIQIKTESILQQNHNIGSLDTEFWLGNDNIHKITASGDFELRVDLKYKGKSYYAAYSKFSVSGEDSDYTFTVGGYSGTAGDSLGYHNGMKFSTYDKDNDEYTSENCAVIKTGAWWYKSCLLSDLNGKWGGDIYKTPRWETLTSVESVSFSEMKIRQI